MLLGGLELPGCQEDLGPYQMGLCAVDGEVSSRRAWMHWLSKAVINESPGGGGGGRESSREHLEFCSVFGKTSPFLGTLCSLETPSFPFLDKELLLPQ